MPQDKDKPNQGKSDQWLRKPSEEQETGAQVRVMAESDVTPELRKALENVAGELAKQPGIVSHLKCQKVTINCPKVTIVDGCMILVTCTGYNG